ncbi:alpha/beta hydrolase [Rhodococcus sp. 1163]|uniref:alpha/beta fold hydrolase n=1 Tax=Rhodococcus sp. 1163 TaxID=1905289 RepID=UPI000A0275A1|nr:alpha/beta hydrolase [Rhodococcus sp. 1163]ORI12865.1 alpha/beta hydrolase [Rhodococcus sp. 1163]
MNTIHVNGATLSYEVSGPQDGTPVVLSHSLFFDHRMFDALAELLASAGHRVFAYDHRNHGESSTHSRADVTVDILTEDAAAFIEELQLGRVHFLGNSLGGFVALRLAARRPELLLSAVAMGSSAEEEHQLEAFAPLVERLADIGGSENIDIVLYIMFGDTSLSAGTPAVEEWRGRIAELKPSIGDSAYQVIHRSRIVDELNGCTVPVLAISGTEDHAYPPPISDVNIAEASGGSYRSVEASGHSVSLEQPAAVAEHVLAHFSAI